MNIWENLQIYKHKTQNKQIPEQIQINTKPVSYTHLDVYKRQHIQCLTVRLPVDSVPRH